MTVSCKWHINEDLSSNMKCVCNSILKSLNICKVLDDQRYKRILNMGICCAHLKVLVSNSFILWFHNITSIKILIDLLSELDEIQIIPCHMGISKFNGQDASKDNAKMFSGIIWESTRNYVWIQNTETLWWRDSEHIS